MKHNVDRCPACIEISGDFIAAMIRMEAFSKPTPPPPKVSKPVKTRSRK